MVRKESPAKVKIARSHLTKRLAILVVVLMLVAGVAYFIVNRDQRPEDETAKEVERVLESFKQQEDSGEARAAYDEHTSTIASKIEEEGDEASVETIENLGRIYWNNGDLDNAGRYYRLALDKAEDEDKDELYIDFLANSLEEISQTKAEQ